MRIVLLLLLTWSTGAAAQGSSERVWVLPFEVDFDSGAANGDAIIGRMIPVNTLFSGDEWSLINIAMVSFADAPGGRPGAPGNPSPVPGPNVFGLTDLTDAVLYKPNQEGKFQWAVGIGLGIPIATDDRLGSGKWLAGPAAQFNYVDGPWRLGIIMANRWSFAGDSDRADVNQFLARGLVRYQLNEKWFFVSAPIITANWDAASGQKWMVPLGGGFGRSVSFGKTKSNLSLQYYANVIKPDGAPDWVIRFGMTFPFSLPAR
jgi:hypothetical protein